MTEDGERDGVPPWAGLRTALARHWACALALSIAVFLLALPLEPIWSSYTHPYLWGPVASDAAGREVDGIRPGYSRVNTATYAVLMIAGLLLARRLLARAAVRIDRGLVLASLPFIALGATLRVLEDSAYYRTPLAYLFISPLIYALIACVLLLLLWAASLIERLPRGTRPAAVALVIAAIGMFSLAVGSGSRWTSPPLVAFTCALLATTFAVTPLPRDRSSVLFYLGISLLLLSVLPIARFVHMGSWDGVGAVETNAWVVPATVGIAAGLTLLTWALWAYAVRRGWTSVAPTAMPLFFAHLLDGTATAVGIEHFGMWEKHWLPSALIDATGTAWVMIPMKLFVVGLFVGLVRGPFRRDIDADPELYHLVYLAVLVLGLAPGLRDMFRVALGV